jgi:carboxymethylenebutenolidase
VVGFDKDDKIEFERIYWDQASMLASSRAARQSGSSITGAEQVSRLLDPSLPSNTLIPSN